MEAHHIKIQCASKESECLAYEHEIKTYIIFIFPEVSKQVKIQFYCHIFSHIWMTDRHDKQKKRSFPFRNIDLFDFALSAEIEEDILQCFGSWQLGSFNGGL